MDRKSNFGPTAEPGPIFMRLFQYEKQLYQASHDGTEVQVFDRGDRRELRFGNRIVQSAVSKRSPDELMLEYTRAMMAGFLVRPDPEYILHLGLGAGSVPRFIHRFFPTVRQRVVEINPKVIEAAYRFFDLPLSPNLMVEEGEAGAYTASNRDKYGLVFMDAFTAHGAAEGVGDPDYYQTLSRQLNPEGWVVNNVWGSDREELERVIGRMAAVFPCLYAIPVHAHSNVILVGGRPRKPPTPTLLRKRAAALTQICAMDFSSWPRRMVRRTYSVAAGGMMAKA